MQDIYSNYYKKYCT